jgi:hypothetical protein
MARALLIRGAMRCNDLRPQARRRVRWRIWRSARAFTRLALLVVGGVVCGRVAVGGTALLCGGVARAQAMGQRGDAPGAFLKGQYAAPSGESVKPPSADDPRGGSRLGGTAGRASGSSGPGGGFGSSSGGGFGEGSGGAGGSFGASGQGGFGGSGGGFSGGF